MQFTYLGTAAAEVFQRIGRKDFAVKDKDDIGFYGVEGGGVICLPPATVAGPGGLLVHAKFVTDAGRGIVRIHRRAVIKHRGVISAVRKGGSNRFVEIVEIGTYDESSGHVITGIIALPYT